MSQPPSQAATLQPDHQVLIYAEELRLMQSVFSASSDLVLAGFDEDFREFDGGQDAIAAKHREATLAMQTWYEEGGE